MDINIEVRKKQLQSLDQYITSSKDKVQSILGYLGWNTKRVLETMPDVMCSVNPRHRIPLRSREEHLKKCSVKTAGYNINETYLSEPLHDPISSIKLDNAKKIEILGQARYNHPKFKAAWNGQDPDPLTSDRLFSTFSPDERLTLYDYCVKNTNPPPAPGEFDVNIDDKKEEKLLTEEELLAKERDAKRRRIKYKSVHTSRNKSHTEVIKEVIENQMELYKEYLVNKEENGNINENYDKSIEADIIDNKAIQGKKEPEDVERPHSSTSRHSTHSGNSRSKSNYEHKKEYHRRDDEYKRSRKEYDRKHGHDNIYDHDSYKEKRRGYKDHRHDYRSRSRDRRERHYKSDRRH